MSTCGPSSEKPGKTEPLSFYRPSFYPHKQSDWHIPIRPGTDGASARNDDVIINENLIDDYVEKYTVGYEELKERVNQYPLEQVAEIKAFL